MLQSPFRLSLREPFPHDMPAEQFNLLRNKENLLILLRQNENFDWSRRADFSSSRLSIDGKFWVGVLLFLISRIRNESLLKSTPLILPGEMYVCVAPAPRPQKRLGICQNSRANSISIFPVQSNGFPRGNHLPLWMSTNPC